MEMMMVDTVVKFLLSDLTRLLKDEADLLIGVEEKVILLKQEVDRMNAFLRSSQGKRDKHEYVKVVVGQIRDVANEARDVIDNYVFDINNHNTKGTLQKFFHSFDKAKMLHNVNNQIEKINTKIKDIYDNKDKYDIDDINSSTTTELSKAAKTVAKTVQRRRSNVEENEVVGFDVYAEDLKKLLLKGNKSLEVVCVSGMVGCGKTTLARKVFKHPRLDDNDNFDDFDCLAWEIATKQFNANQFLLSLLRTLKAIPEEQLNQMEIAINKSEKEEIHDSTAETLEFKMLKSKLRRYLSDMKYLIVIDDVWKSHEFEEIRDAFPDDNMGSRILITTREHKDVAIKICTSAETCYKLEPLSKEDSWVLFSKKVFMEEKNYSSSLEEAGRKIANACEGLPLAIIVIAGILRGKEKSERVWEKVMGNVNWYINHEDGTVKEIVRLSYDNLPNYLKPCFLYFGIYPEDYEIPVRQLLQLWIAEGFIEEAYDQRYGGNMVIEDIAEEFLEELISRNLIQVDSRRTDGGVKTCRIHDLLRDLCITESGLESFLEVRTKINISKGGKPRRLSIHGNLSYYLSQGTRDHLTTRSFFNFCKDKYELKDLLMRRRENFKLIRVLDMGQVKEAQYVVGKIGEKFHLRYLRMPAIPASLQNLHNVETLDLRGSIRKAQLNEIWELKRLRHLYVSGTETTISKIPGKKVLPNIQTISGVCLNENISEQLREDKFPNLRKLGVHCLNSELNPIEYFKTLECLIHLTTLKIIYPMMAPLISTAVGFPPNITKITLVGGFHLSEIAKSLGSLAKLMYLKISEEASKPHKEFELEYIESGCFPQLQVLKLIGLECKKWEMVEGAMPQLRLIVIKRCKFSITTTLPSAEFFPALREVQVLSSSKEVVGKVKHLESINNGSCKLIV